jgi:hypothetical protein
MKKMILLTTTFLLTACVSTHKDNMGQAVGVNADNELLVSVEKNRAMSTENFVVLEYSIENKGSDFKRFDQVDIEIDPKLKEKVKIVVGQDLVNWSEGIRNKIEKDNHNFRMFMTGLTAVAATSANLSKDRDFAVASAGVAAAGAGILTVDSFMQIRDNLRNAQKSDSRGLIPENHILASPVSVPPNLFLKRFAVFYVKGDATEKFYKMKMSFTKEGEKKSYLVRFKEAPASENPLLACSEDEKVSKPLYFRQTAIYCAKTCRQFHQYNQKTCEKNFASHERRLKR